MATSKPEYQNYVYQNASLYCALYKRRVINISGVAANQWYWMPSNKSGDIIDFRANALNSGTTYTSEANALANIPSGYGTLVVDRWQSDKYLSYACFFPFDNVALTKQAITEWVALGANNIVIQIEYGDIFTSASAQTANSSGSYAKVDDIINYAKDTGKKVTLIINLDVDDGNVGNFWGLSNNEKDEWDYPLRIGYGSGHPSLADTSAVATIKDFFQKVISRYSHSSFLGNQLLQVYPTLTVHKEYGYNITNQYYPVGSAEPVNEYYALSGYSATTITGFRTWLNSVDNPDKYNTIDDLNAAWSTSFASFSVVTPPTTGKAVGTATLADYTALFSTNIGKDWYKYLVSLLYKFAYDLKSIVDTVNSTNSTNMKFVLGFGGNSPNDEQCTLRLSRDVIRWADYSDGLKTAFGTDDRNSNVAITLDYIQNYPKKIITELHHIDFLGSANIKDNIIKSGTAAIQNGAKEIMFISMIQHGPDYYPMMKDVFTALKPIMEQNNEGGRTGIIRNTSFTLGELLNSGGQIGLNNWIAAGGGSGNRVNINFTNTIGVSSNDFPYSLSLFDIQTYYLKQNDIKNSVYGRTATESGPYNATQQDYNANRVPFLLTAFGITYVSGTKTKSTVEIIDENGVVWVKCVQTIGVTNTEQNGKYANNHPEFRYISNITEDCRFWLPIPASGGYYDVKITVYDAACRFDVYHADNNAPGGIAYNESKTPTAAGTNETIRITRSQMLQTNVNQRVIKINNNKWS